MTYQKAKKIGTPRPWHKSHHTKARLIASDGFPIGETYVYSERHGGREAESNAVLIAHWSAHFDPVVEALEMLMRDPDADPSHIQKIYNAATGK